jgi:hypothetical protein
VFLLDEEEPGRGSTEEQETETTQTVTLVEEPRSPAPAPRADLTPTVAGLNPGSSPAGNFPGIDHCGTKGGAPGGTGLRWLPAVQQARSVVYLVDHSLSMAMGHGLAEAQRELLSALERMPASTRFQLIAFNGAVEYLGSDSAAGLRPADELTLPRTRRALAGLTASGSTCPCLALKRGLALRPEALVLLTDSDQLTPREIQEVTAFNGGRTAIHAVVFHWRQENVAGTPLQQLAQRNQGTYRLVVPQP